ncbi:MAG: hypothetical protein HY000_30815 [Planctomycetes bacterium]|nr:hypothetical protein [Planctomycetota bacterium]
MARIASLLLIFAVCLPHIAAAGETAEAKTVMTNRGKLIFSDAFGSPLEKPWNVAKGAWDIVDSAVQVRELKSDHHGAVARRALPVADFVAQYSFKLDGAKSTTFSVNCPQGHCCRVSITPNSLVVRKDSHDHNRADKAVTLGQQRVQIAPGVWHTLVIEIHGPELLATLDGKTVAYGSHESIAVTKSNIGLTVAGESASFKDLRVWEAQPNSQWAANKEKLLKGQ